MKKLYAVFGLLIASVCFAYHPDPLAIIYGGTGQTTKTNAFNALSPMTTLGDIIYENSTPSGTRLAGNTTATKKFLTQTGTGTISAVPGWNTIAAADVPTLNQNTTGTASNVTGIVAIANGGTGQSTKAPAFNALSPMTAVGSLIIGGTSGSGTELLAGSNGNFLKMVAGSPAWAASSFTPVAPTVQIFLSGTAQTYTRPTSPTPLYIRVRAVGGGGGGSGGGTGGGAGGNGGDTTFSGGSISAGGGVGGTTSGGGNTGGTGGVSSTSGTGIAIQGGAGQAGTTSTIAGGAQAAGGNSAFGGGGGGGQNGATGQPGSTNAGGGGGGGTGTAASVLFGSGGGGAGYAELIITSPASTYTYTIGAAGTPGTAGTSGTVGDFGGSGMIYVEEFYQ